MAAYTVTLNKNGGPANGTNSVSATYGSAMPSATMPTRVGYTFAGYYDTSATSGGTQYYTAAGASARTWNKQAAATLYARWTKNNINVTLNLGNYGQYRVLPYDGKIEHWDDKIYDNLKRLAQHGDGKFASGLNDISAYQFNRTSDSPAAGTSTVTRISKRSDNPIAGSNYEIQVDSYINTDYYNGSSYSCRMGWVQSTTSAASKTFVHVFVAKIPKNVQISPAYNSTGDDRVVKFLAGPRDSDGNVIGTSKYELYAYELQCGSTGTFSTFGYIYLLPRSVTIPSTTTWYIAYSEVFETTRSQVLSIPYNTTVTDLPIPEGSGRKFRGWGWSYSGAEKTRYGRDMFYKTSLSVHLNAYMSDWSQYVSGNSGNGMRLISCTEGGGWNIEPNGTSMINFACYDGGASSYKSALSNVRWDSLSSGWHSFDIVFDGTNVKGYLDEELIATSANYTNAPNGVIGYPTSTGLFLGAEAGSDENNPTAGYYFTGYITNTVIKSQSTRINDSKSSLTVSGINTSIVPYWGGPDGEGDINLYLHTNNGLMTQTYIPTQYDGTSYELPAPVKIGSTFKGWYYDFNGRNYLSFGRVPMWTDKFSVHFDAYMDDWSQYQNNMSTLSCTEGGGWSFWFKEFVYVEMYDSGASAYKSITSNVKYADLTGWNSFDLVYNGTNFKLYLNDELLGTSATMSGPISYNSRNSILMGVEPGGYGDAYGRSPTTYTGSKFVGKIANFKIEHVDYKLPRDIYTLQVPAQDSDVYALWEPNNSVKTYGYPKQLAGTTWYFNEYPYDDIFSSLQKEFKITYTIDNVTYSRFTLDFIEGYLFSRNPNTQVDTDFWEWDEDGGQWTSPACRTISLIGGEDINNPTLIQFFEKCATLQTSSQWITGKLNTLNPITDLTNTLWIFNDTIDLSYLGGTKEWDVQIFTGNNDGVWGLYDGVEKILIEEDNGNLVLRYSDSTKTTTYDIYNQNGWVNQEYKHLYIQDGDDATDSELIEFLKANAHRYHPIVPSVNNTQWHFNETLLDAGPSMGWWVMGHMKGDSYYEFEGMLSESGSLYDPTGSPDWYTNGAWVNDSYRYVEFTGESYPKSSLDASLIYWLELNATLLVNPYNNYDPPVMDLTNTKWKFNDTINFTSNLLWHNSSSTSFKLNHITSDGRTFDKFLFENDGTMGPFWWNNDDLIYDSNGWDDDTYKIITITGGNDATNGELITWMQNNAVLLNKPQVVKVWNGTSWDIIE